MELLEWWADKARAEQAGEELPFCAAVIQLRTDWSEVAHTMQVVVEPWAALFFMQGKPPGCLS